MSWQKLKNQAKSAVGAVKDSAEKISVLGKEKLQETVEGILSEINGLKPVLLNSGFVVGEIKVTLSLPPEFTVFIENTGQEKKSLEKTLAEEADTMTSLQKTFLRSLLKANELAQISDKYGYRFGKYELAISLPPRVTVRLVPK
jgi:hypothetical protein